MAGEGSLQTNLIAVSGMVANPEGRLIYPDGEVYYLEWIFKVPVERVQRARELVDEDAGHLGLKAETLAGWFCLSSDEDLLALKQLQRREWQEALRVWQSLPDDIWAKHNLATLHRLLYLACPDKSSLEHLFWAFGLYHELGALKSGAGYLFYAKWSEDELAQVNASSTFDAAEVMAALKAYAEAKGMPAYDCLQEKLMQKELNELRVQSASLMQELLPFQGIADSPPRDLLDKCEQEALSLVVFLGGPLKERMLPNSSQYREICRQLAELCGLLSQSLHKAGDKRLSEKWLVKARVWDASTALKWEIAGLEGLGDEQAASVVFPQAPLSPSWKMPRAVGPWWLGRHAKPIAVSESGREEWLEAIRLLGVAIYPLARFTLFRDPDTKEILRGESAALGLGDTLWQALSVLCLSLLVASFAFFLRASLGHRLAIVEASPGAQSAASVELARAKIVERLEQLALDEAQMLKSSHQDAGKLRLIRRERLELLEKIEKLNGAPSR